MDSKPYVCTLSAELQEKARRELNEDPQRRADSIEAIRKWLQEQSDLPSRKDDKFILRFLRICKFNLENTKKRIRTFYEIRSSIPEWFTNRDPLRPEIQELLDLGLFLPLPGYDREGRKVCFAHHALFDPRKHKMEDIMKLEQIIGDILMEDEQSQICGFSGIQDLQGFSFSHLRSLTFGVVRKQVNLWQTGNPARLKMVNFINESWIYMYIFTIMKLFMKDKLRKRIRFHGKDLESLHEAVPPEILPEEYGGSAGKLQDMIDSLKTEITNRREQFLNDDEFTLIKMKK